MLTSAPGVGLAVDAFSPPVVADDLGGGDDDAGDDGCGGEVAGEDAPDVHVGGRQTGCVLTWWPGRRVMWS
jgi:hypothetical protein